MPRLHKALQPLPSSITEPARTYLEELRQTFYRTGRTLKELEAATHVSDSNWSRYLSGQSDIPDDALTALASLARLSRQDWLALRDLRTRAEAVVPTEPSRSQPVPRQLPAAVTHFVGRAVALGWLDAQIRAYRPAQPSGEPVVVTIEGGAGVGKTALAVTWAHSVTARFTSGQLYADLQGYTPGNPPALPASVLARFVRALGTRAEDTPTDQDELVALYRSLVAERRLLVLLDNAASAEQVRPLIPGGSGCVVVVTSRNSLPGLGVSHGARTLTLDPLSSNEAEALLTDLLGPDRASHDDAAELAARCAYLPLALRIVAAKLLTEPHHTVADMTERLRRDGRLAALRLDDGSEAAVRATFDASYDSLAPEQRRAFRFLGLVPGSDVGHEAVGALLDVEPATARALLDGLAARHLLHRPARLRYQFHDLLREYSSELCRTADDETARHAALERLYEFYVHRTRDATTILRPNLCRLPLGRPAAIPEPAPLEGRDDAQAWLEAEHPSLVAAVVHTASHGPYAVAWQLADALRGYYFVRPTCNDWLAVARAGLDAATRERDLQGTSAMHNSLGQAYHRLGNLTPAVDHLRRALEASQAADWPDGEATAHSSLGGLFALSGIDQDGCRLQDAIAHYRAAAAVLHRIGDPTEAAQLGNVGFVLYQTGAFTEAVGYCVAALAIMRRTANEYGEAIYLDNLGGIYHQLGRLDDALAHVEAALAIYRRMCLPDLEAECLGTLARICRDRGDPDAARRHAEESLGIARSNQETRVEAYATNTLGTLAPPEEAAVWHREALGLAAGIGYRHGQVEALIGLATADGDPNSAASYADQAVAEAHAIGFRALEAQARTVRARVAIGRGAYAAAEADIDTALEIHAWSGCRLGLDELETMRDVLVGQRAGLTG